MAAPDVLVTGSAGHLGCALMLSLPAQGYTPVGIDVLASPTTTHAGSVADRPFVASIFARYPTIRHVLHVATLHKPHVGSHSKSDFVSVNIAGTLNLLEEASGSASGSASASAAPGPAVDSFVFTSTTSAFGRALSPAPGDPAAWISEDVAPVPKNIYGVTKVAAEDLCRLVHEQSGMPTVVLRTSRFFPEEDDDEERRGAMGDENLKVLELAYRRADIADVADACVCAMRRAREIGGWGKYVVSAPPPFANDPETLRRLDEDPEGVYAECVPGIREVFRDKGWKFLGRIDRVYDSSRAVAELGWKPKYTVRDAIERIRAGREWRSELTFRVGRKGYHAVSTGVYTQR